LPPDELLKQLENELVHQDMLDYSEHLVARVKCFLEDGFSIICEVYNQFKDFPPLEEAAEALAANGETYAFEYFNTKESS
jgi:hypothetical protein